MSDEETTGPAQESAESTRDGEGQTPASTEQAPAPAAEPAPAPAARIKVGYEFTEVQNQQLSGLTSAMGVLWPALAALGFAQLLFALSLVIRNPGDFGHYMPLVGVSVIGGALIFAAGLTLRSAAPAFQAIVDTEGADIDFLMGALKTLEGFFWRTLLLIWPLILGLLVSVIKLRSAILSAF